MVTNILEYLEQSAQKSGSCVYGEECGYDRRFHGHSQRGIPGKLEEFADYDGHMYKETAAKFSRIFGEELCQDA